jgi:hypothetical protein
VFDQAVAEIRNSGAYAARTVSHVADSLRKDMADAAAKMGPRWEAFSEKSTDLYGVWRDRGGIFLAEAARAVGGWLEQTSTRLEQQTYRAGEVAFRGEFDCAACGGRISLGVSGPLPPCPNCGGAQLRRID